MAENPDNCEAASGAAAAVPRSETAAFGAPLSPHLLLDPQSLGLRRRPGGRIALCDTPPGHDFHRRHADRAVRAAANARVARRRPAPRPCLRTSAAARQ